MEFFKDLFSLIGRICVSAMFLWAAYEMIRHWDAAVSYLKSKHVPQVRLVAPIFLAARVIGGVTIFLGWYAQLGALILLVVTITSVVFFHPFWEKRGTEGEMEKAYFAKELVTIGALFLILALGAGNYGLSHG